MAGIYIHIPFCKQACFYCDFYFSTQQDYRAILVEALADEILLQKEYLGKQSVESIYFGGGTPSLLSENELARLLDTINKNFRISDNPEITLEANPDDLTPSYLQTLKKIGVNRLSIGIQTFDDEYLKKLNRAHNRENALKVVPWARMAGFKNISIDLMYALPEQNESQWKIDIAQAIALQPEHISAYTLTIEPKTVFGFKQSKGLISIPEDDIAASFFDIMVEAFSQHGYLQYEVSNFCKPDFYSKHNSSYWLQKHYLGIGPSAHSFNKESRQFNVANNHQYIKSISEKKIPATIENLTKAEKINDVLLTGLRTIWGVSLVMLKDEFDCDLLTIHQHKINPLLENNLAKIENEKLLLTKKGLLVADKIASDLFI